MDTNQVKYFVTLAKTLNFSRAAEINGVTQPALTKSIKKLEESVGEKLIHRDGKDTRLTDFGKKVLNTFETIVLSESKIRELADLAATGHREKILFGIASTITPKDIFALFEKFVEELPHSRVIFSSVEDDNLATQVLAGKLDCCLWSDFREKNIKLASHKLYNEKLLLACAPSHRFAAMDAVPLTELQNVPLVDRVNCEFREIALQYFAEQGVHINAVVQSTREDWAQKMVMKGLGVCTLPEHSKIIPELVLKPINGVSLSRNIYFVLVSGSSSSKGAKGIERVVRTTYRVKNARDLLRKTIK